MFLHPNWRAPPCTSTAYAASAASAAYATYAANATYAGPL